MEAVDIDKAFDNLVLIDQIESEKGYKVSFSSLFGRKEGKS